VKGQLIYIVNKGRTAPETREKKKKKIRGWGETGENRKTEHGGIVIWVEKKENKEQKNAKNVAQEGGGRRGASRRKVK